MIVLGGLFCSLQVSVQPDWQRRRGSFPQEVSSREVMRSRRSCSRRSCYCQPGDGQRRKHKHSHGQRARDREVEVGDMAHHSADRSPETPFFSSKDCHVSTVPLKTLVLCVDITRIRPHPFPHHLPVPVHRSVRSRLDHRLLRIHRRQQLGHRMSEPEGELDLRRRPLVLDQFGRLERSARREGGVCRVGFDQTHDVLNSRASLRVPGEKYQR